MTYEEVAGRFGVRLCPDAEGRLHCDLSLPVHDQGMGTMNGYVHWTPRRVTRRGLYNFLRHAVDVNWGTAGRRYAERLWMRETIAYEYARELGIRFPRAWADPTRAHVRGLMAGYRSRQFDKETRQRIRRWMNETTS